jgi:hypothetical protein
MNLLKKKGIFFMGNNRIFITSIFTMLCFFSDKIISKNYMTPRAYGIGIPYGKSLFSKSIPAMEGENLFEELDKSFEIYPEISFIGRFVNQAFDKRSIKRDLSYIFIGSDDFALQNLFVNNSLDNAPAYVTNLANVTVNPTYDYSEKGLVLGIGAQKEHDFNGRVWNVRISAHLPVIKNRLTNSKGYDALTSNKSGTSLSTTDSNGVTTFTNMNVAIKNDGTDTVYAIKMQDAFDKNFIELNNATPKTWYARNYACFPATDLDTDIANGQVKYFDGSVKKDIFVAGSLQTKLQDTEGVELAVGLTTPSSTNDVAQPLIGKYYSLDGSTKLPQIDGIDLAVFPNIKSNIKTTATNTWYTLNSEGVNVPNGTKVDTTALAKDTEINVIGDGEKIKFSTPQVVIINYFGDLSSDFKDFKLENYKITESINNDGTWGDWTGNIDLLESDGTYNNLSGSTNSPSTFLYETDYTNLLDASNNTNTKDLYIIGKNDVANQNSASTKLYNKIISAYNNEAQFQADVALDSAQGLLEGWYANGESSSNTKISQPKNVYKWNEYSQPGISDLDLECSIGSQWDSQKLAGDLIFGMILPTAAKTKDDYNYLQVSLGNGGHYEFRAGLQAAYDINSWIRFAGYAHGAIALGSNENLIPQFYGASNWGLQPVRVQTNVSWQSLVGALDLSCFANQWTAISMKYQFYFKTKDSYNPSKNTAVDAFGITNKLDPTFSGMREMSKQQSHKLILSLSSNINEDVYVSFGASTIVAGKNIGCENDFFINAMISY